MQTETLTASPVLEAGYNIWLERGLFPTGSSASVSGGLWPRGCIDSSRAVPRRRRSA